MTAASCGAEYRTRFTFTPEGDGTRVDVELRTRAVRLWAKLFVPLAYLMMGTMKKAVARDLDELRESIEGQKRAA